MSDTQLFDVGDPVRMMAEGSIYQGQTGKIVAVLPNVEQFGRRYVVQPDKYHLKLPLNLMFLQTELEAV